MFGLILIGGGVGYRWHQHNQVVAAEQKKQAVAKQAKRKAEQQRKIAEKINADPFNKTRSTNQQITHILKLSHFVGTALVVKNNHVVYQKGFGYSDAATKVKNGPQSKYQILSIQKSLTAAAIMQLVQAKKIKLSDKLSKYYPSISHGHEITLRMMLDMASGLRQTGSSKDELPEDEVVNEAVTHIGFTPAKYNVFHYSSVNFLLLAGIIRQQTGQSYQSYFEKHFIKKLGLNGSGFVTDGLGKHATLGYSASETQILPDYTKPVDETKAQMANELGTGQVYMTAGDLFKVESGILKGKLMTKANVAILHTPSATGTYGGGVYNEQPAVIRSHGVGYGYESALKLSTDGKNGVVLLSNCNRQAVTIQTATAKIFEELMLQTN